MPSKKPYSIFKNGGIYQIQVCYRNKRKSESLKVKNFHDAERIAKIRFPYILMDMADEKAKEISFKTLSHKWLMANHGWADRTLILNSDIINKYNEGAELPKHPTTRSIWVRTINACWNWGLKNELITKHKKLKNNKVYPRSIYLKDIQMIYDWKPYNFMVMCLLMAKAGVRIEEIRKWKKSEKTYDKENLFITVKTKGKDQMDLNMKFRPVRINKELVGFIDKIDSFDYTRKKGSNLLKENYGEGLQLRDLRRTFAVNKYREGMPILTISRLMGHSSLSMTTWYLSPFTIDEIEL